MTDTIPYSTLVEQLRNVVGTPEEATFELGGAIDRVLDASGLDAGSDGIRTFGEALGEAIAEVELVAAEQLVWTQLACIQRAWLSDFEAISQMWALEPVCAGFVAARVRTLAEASAASARDEGSRLAIVWTIRLTGYPLLYDYVEREEIVDFLDAGLGAVCEGLSAAGELDAAGADALWNELVRAACEEIGSLSLRLSPEMLGSPSPAYCRVGVCFERLPLGAACEPADCERLLRCVDGTCALWYGPLCLPDSCPLGHQCAVDRDGELVCRGPEPSPP